MSNRDEFIRTMQEKLTEWNLEVDKLTIKAREASADVKQEFNEQIELLKVKQADARLKIEELRHAGENALADLKSGVELAWADMGEAIASARLRFK